MAGRMYFVLALICVVPIIYACNEAICASVVSKCMLTQSCKCDLKDCSCCKDCFNCLSYLYSECCSCVEELADGVPGLFAALTSDPDPQQRWLSITYPVDIDLCLACPGSKESVVNVLEEELGYGDLDYGEDDVDAQSV
ncbi:BMP binding protein [Operophtera brumata]|uniref:BMP binding protein n=1 Tax=Operophtera brumata TaxID=104452 RepID=A0A0L7KRQ9_OPEBR|nr:BMP binding protein [Operophtera brumata]